MDDVDDLIRRAWPGGVPSDASLARSRLSADSTVVLARRMKAVLDWIEPMAPEDRPASVAEAARRAGVAVSRFHSLTAAWRADRSLAAFGVRAHGRRGKVDDGRRAELRARVREAVAREPSLGAGTIRRILVEQGGALPSSATLIRMIEEERRGLVPGAFGCAVVFDAAGADLVDPQGLRLRLYAAIDRDTGYVLGATLATERSRSYGYVWAALDALERIDDLDLGSLEGCAGEPALDVRFDPDDHDGKLLFGERLGLLGSPRHVADQALGRAVVRALGPKVGGVWIGTGSRELRIGFRSGRSVHLPTVDRGADAPIVDAVDQAIARHNVQRVKAAGDRPPARSAGEVVLGLRRRLSQVAALAELLDALPYFRELAGGVDDLPSGCEPASQR